MRSHAKAPSAGSIWLAAAAALAVAVAALAFMASSASATVFFANAQEATGVQKDSATLNGYFGNDGQGAHYFFEWGETEAYGHTTPASPGTAIPGSGFEFVPPTTVSGLLGGTTYHYRLVISDPDGSLASGDATFTTAPAPENLKADPPTSVTDTGAELNASFDGDGVNAVSYYFEWGTSTAYGNTTPAPPGNSVPAASGRVHVPPVAIGGLEQGVTYHYRVIAKSAAGQGVSPDATFKSAEAPIVGNVRSANVTASSGKLLGSINPRFGQTSYRFEWGPTAAYGNSTPVPDGDAGATDTSVPVEADLQGLDPNVTYHFRLVASNQYGTTASPDQTFGFYPPACPNSQLRQETRSNDLPDCRAFELVSPSFAQGAVIMPATAPTSGLATSPSRIAYAANFGVFPASAGEPPNSMSDLYVSTRTDNGWTQRYVGLPATQGVFMGGPPGGALFSLTTAINFSEVQRGTQASPGLDRIVDYNWGYPGSGGFHAVASNAPYVWDSSTGHLLERWPRNFAEVPGGEHFVGVPQASADLSHLVFTSNVVFAEPGEASGGEIKCCEGGAIDHVWPKASVYDYDTKTGATVLASVKKDGTPFQGRAFDISEDGSHILMANEAIFQAAVPAAPLEPKEAIVGAQLTGPLYLRVSDDETYEIAPGRQIEYAGSTGDGSTVYLASDEQLTPDDHDSSKDLFVWHQSDPNSLTRVSIGDHSNAGNTDECTPSEGWTTACGISTVKFDAPRSAEGVTGNGHTDNYLASKSGDVYFESPEQLVGGKGEQGERNLYLYRGGALRYVATMSPSHRIARMQTTPTGSHMALVTASNLTDYDSGGHLEMYVYDPQVGRVVCASCRSEDQQPTSEVRASQNGLFLTDNGRVFFSTKDGLAPRDTNEQIDVYEYTEGKAQLITTGLGPGIGQNGGNMNAIGLIGVSANGTDAYFGTTDNLVTQDHNGASLKVYDARTGGGFPAEREEPKCTAADECHGTSSNPPALPADRTSAGLGTPHKAKAHKAKKHRKAHKHKKKRAKKAKRKQGGGKQGGKRHG